MSDRGVVIELYVAADAREAHYVSMVLKESGIEARVVGETPQAVDRVWPEAVEVAQGGSPRVWIHKRDEARARRIVAEWEEQRRSETGPARPSWECARCGEDVEGHFDICWNCQSPKGPLED